MQGSFRFLAKIDSQRRTSLAPSEELTRCAETTSTRSACSATSTQRRASLTIIPCGALRGRQAVMVAALGADLQVAFEFFLIDEVLAAGTFCPQARGHLSPLRGAILWPAQPRGHLSSDYTTRHVFEGSEGMRRDDPPSRLSLLAAYKPATEGQQDSLATVIDLQL